MNELHGGDQPPPPDSGSQGPGAAGGDPSPGPRGSSTGLDSNIAGGLSYVLGFITGIIFLVVEKEDRYVRFHAAQSVVLSVALLVLWVAFSILGAIVQVIPGLGPVLGMLLFLVWGVVGLAAFILWIVLLIKAFTGNEWEVPVIGEQARRVILKEEPAGGS